MDTAMAGVPSKARDPTAFDASETFLSFHLEATNPISSRSTGKSKKQLRRSWYRDKI
jgi:hypothetical protein